MSYSITEREVALLRDDCPTRQLAPLELEELVEPERRYTPDDELGCEPTTSSAAPTATPRVRQRTVRMRVFNFKPLIRPADEVTITTRSASRAARVLQLLASALTLRP